MCNAEEVKSIPSYCRWHIAIFNDCWWLIDWLTAFPQIRMWQFVYVRNDDHTFLVSYRPHCVVSDAIIYSNVISIRACYHVFCFLKSKRENSLFCEMYNQWLHSFFFLNHSVSVCKPFYLQIYIQIQGTLFSLLCFNVNYPNAKR